MSDCKKAGRNRDSKSNTVYKMVKRAEVNKEKKWRKHLDRLAQQVGHAAPDFLKGRARALRRVQLGITQPQDVSHVCIRHGITPAEANAKPEKAPHHVVYPWKAELTAAWYGR